MADGAGVRFDVDSDAMPLADGVGALCDALDIDPWHVSSCGTLLAAVDPADADDVVGALRDRGTPAAVVGEVTDGEGLYVDGARQSHPGADPSWEAFASLQAAADGAPTSGARECPTAVRRRHGARTAIYTDVY